MKLMRGIGDAEMLLQKEKQPDANGVSAAEKGQQDMKPEGAENAAPSDSAPKNSVSPKKTEAVKIRTKSKKKTGKEKTIKEKKIVFSFRADVSSIFRWRAYCTAVSETMENIGSAAMDEYISRHRLSGNELAIFEAIQRKNAEQ